MWSLLLFFLGSSLFAPRLASAVAVVAGWRLPGSLLVVSNSEFCIAHHGTGMLPPLSAQAIFTSTDCQCVASLALLGRLARLALLVEPIAILAEPIAHLVVD